MRISYPALLSWIAGQNEVWFYQVRDAGWGEQGLFILSELEQLGLINSKLERKNKETFEAKISLTNEGKKANERYNQFLSGLKIPVNEPTQ